MDTLLKGYCRALEVLMVAALAIMVVLVFGNVVLRYGFNSGITVSEEMSRWFFVWLTFLGSIVAIREHGHLGTDMLVSRLPRRARKAVAVVAHVAMLYVTWLLFSGSFTQTKINLDVEAPVTGLSMGFFYGVGVLFAVSSAVLLAWELWRIVSGQARDDELVMVKENEDLPNEERQP
jgi:TRAP-type transport system small permease protein